MHGAKPAATVDAVAPTPFYGECVREDRDSTQATSMRVQWHRAARIRQRAGIFCATLLVVVGARTPSGPVARSSQASLIPVHSYAGGCAGTTVTDAIPPVWAQGGWNHISGTPWPVAWALGSPGDAVAFLFAVQLVAGPSPRSDGSNNKIQWVIKDAGNFEVDGHPSGSAEPAVSTQGGPSIIDVPSPGCWKFQLTTVPQRKLVSTVNLEALPHGSLPPPPN